MPQSIPSGSRPAAAPRAGLAIGSTGFTVMIIVLLVAIVFAANANDLIGWLVVAIAAAWLVFAVVVFLQVRRGVRSASQKVDRTVEQMRSDAAALRGSQQPAPAAAAPAPAGDPMRDTKLDHSFKIAQVQVKVVREQLAAGGAMDREMVDRALETIDITAANARDMIKESRGQGGSEGPVSGTVIG